MPYSPAIQKRCMFPLAKNKNVFVAANVHSSSMYDAICTLVSYVIEQNALSHSSEIDERNHQLFYLNRKM